MSDKIAESLEKKSADACPPALANFSNEIAGLCPQPSQSHLSESAKSMLSGFGINSEKATDAALSAGTGAVTGGLGLATLKGAEIGVGKLAASAMDPALRLVGGVMRYDALASGQIVRELIAEPFAPRMLQAGMRGGLYGAAAGLALYGAYEGYQYLKNKN